jgi:tetratricopeptide (TPR) repeat protein
MLKNLSTKKKALIGAAAAIVLIGIGVGVWYYRASSVPEIVFPINKADTIASWNFKGAYSEDETLVAQAHADIAHLTGLLGKGQYDNYDLYNGIGNDDVLLGDGQGAYAAYAKAAAIHPDKGLVYTNIGHLMNLLGANYTAADAYAKAVAVEPAMLQYHLARLDFLTKQLPNDNDAIRAALADASKQFGDTAPVLVIEAQWLADQKRYADAITAYKQAKLLSPGKDTSAMDKAIAALNAKLAAQ